ncbi:MAG: F0F1 ATP synthase subunit A [Chloroflexi bacterium]|nr:MAG: F0F1 ATP synthase subunit A [Chloroflexota bacterium]
MTFLAASPPGTHPLTPICGDGYLNLQVIKFYYCAVTVDTLVSSAVAIIVTLAIGFFVASRLRPGVPSKLQMVLEFLVSYVRDLIGETVGADVGFILPIAATAGLYIFVANWLDFFPLGGITVLKPANSDLNQTLAMALVVFLVVEGYAIRVRGIGGYLKHFMRPPFPPLTIIEEIVKPVTLSLRLFGNIFAGLLMVYLITLVVDSIPAALPLSAIALIAWKFFDVFFVGTIQAFIFMLLTIIYFGQAREGLESH